MGVDILAVQVKSWLKAVLSKEGIQKFSVNINGTSEKGAGYIGDVIFVAVEGIDNKNKHKEYDFVLKCSKPSEALMEKSPAFAEAFVREAYAYETIFPSFKQFQIDRGIENTFDSVPKCYGVFSDGFRRVIVLENLKKVGYDLWDCKKPLTRQHIEFVVKEYAKFHATSVALKEQEPEKFQKLLDGMVCDVLKLFVEKSDFASVFENNIEELYCLLQNNLDDLEEDVLKKWLKFKETVTFVVNKMAPSADELQVITHGDCWSNNFMYKYKDDEECTLSNVAILDWQVMKLHSPVIDLSYFLFACLSERDILDMNNILELYYNTFSDYLTKLGSSSKSHTFDKFFQEWKKFSKHGIAMSVTPLKAIYTDEQDKPDMAESADNGDDISKSFQYDIKDKISYINRMKPIVKYATDAELFN